METLVASCSRNMHVTWSGKCKSTNAPHPTLLWNWAIGAIFCLRCWVCKYTSSHLPVSWGWSLEETTNTWEDYQDTIVWNMIFQGNWHKIGEWLVTVWAMFLPTSTKESFRRWCYLTPWLRIDHSCKLDVLSPWSLRCLQYLFFVFSTL